MSYQNRETSTYSGEPYELYLFQTQNQSWFMTSGDVERAYQAQVYKPVPGMLRTSTKQTAELSGTACKVTIPLDHEIAQLFVAFIPSSPLSVVIYRGHDGEPESETVVNFTGRVTFAKFGDACELNCAPEQELLKRNIPNAFYQKPCCRILYSPGCGVDRLSYRVAGTVTLVSADGLTVRAAEFATKPDGFLTAGYIEKGLERRMITGHAGDTVTLLNGLTSLKAGDTAAAFAGCQRDYATCGDKFNNQAQFLGFEWIPANNPFSGGVE